MQPEASSILGLSTIEALKRAAHYGLNQLPPLKRRSNLLRFIDQFNHALIYLLLFAAAATFFLQHWIDCGVILGVILINACIGYIQEGKAENAINTIAKLLPQLTTVLRDGQKKSILAENLVPGDMVILNTGDRVSADLKLIKADNLQIDQSTLTGESIPVDKRPDQDLESMVYAGSIVTHGSAYGLVVKTGLSSELGQLNKLIKAVPKLITPLVVQINQFSKQLTIIIAIIAIFSFGIGLFRGNDWLNVFMTVVGIFVAAVPEGLPAIVTIALAVGVVNMAKKNVIIRRLPAVETLGSISVICTDKTGTLTHNEMTVKSIILDDEHYEVSGEGYAPNSDIVLNNDFIVKAAILCNDSSVYKEKDAWIVQGDPTEAALYSLALKAKMMPNEVREAYPRLSAVPFDSKHKYMATLHHDTHHNQVVYLKGSPEKIFSLCAPFLEEKWQADIKILAEKGERVLAIGYYYPEKKIDILTEEKFQSKVKLLGLIGMMDPPRATVRQAILDCKTAGIKIKMITGDHVLTAHAVGKMIGLSDNPIVMSGHEIEKLDDLSLMQRIQGVDVFARTTPAHKFRLVQALQAAGEIVAMTGDGVNDAPALKKSNVGIAMGLKGTEIARDAAEVVLTDDNFKSIIDAISVGRCVYDNIRKSFLFILPTDLGEALILIIALYFGYQLPITPVQILWINMITAVALALALAFEPIEAGTLRRRPRDPRKGLIDTLLLWRIIFVAMLLLFLVFSLFFLMQYLGRDIEYTRTVTVNTLVLCEVFYLFNARFIYNSSFSIKGLFENKYIIVSAVTVISLQIFYTYAHFMQVLFQSKALLIVDWGLIILAAIVLFLCAEFEKYILRKNI